MAKQNNQNGTTSVITNSFIKGMNKDITQSMEPDQSWWHARNAANNSTDGDLGVIGNEPSNLQCGVIPYTIIGAIHRFGDEWIVFSTDDINSEIGRFDDSECKYTSLVNDPCLAFNRKHLITGAAKENFDCTWSVYWDDANNPSRHLNIDDIPWKQYISSAAGDPCIVYSDIEPKQLNCEKIRLAPLLDTPCVSLEKSVDGGMITNGSYQAFVAYTENEQRVTDYIGISNVQSLWSHQGSGGSLNVSVTNLDTDYDYYELVLLIRQQGQVFAKRIGLYSTQQKDINIDFIDDQLVAIDLKVIPQRSPAYEKSQAMYVVNDWLIRQGPVEQFDFNYQPIANEIKVNWVSNQIDSKYYYLGGNKVGFLRDEQYAFFIRWIYNTGERSSSYHIPGRAPQPYTINGIPTLENAVIYGDNTLDVAGDPLFKVYNTGAITSQGYSEPQEDGSSIIARGQMGYWESTERYPINKPDIWGDLCGLPIRHHKFPTEEVGGGNSPLHISTTNGDLINLLGVEFTNIGRPKNNDGSYITNVVGYEILRGSRAGAKSILAKGLFRNMREYDVPNSEDLIGNDVQGLYPNYPYNDLRPDVYFHDGTGGGSLNRTDGCHNFTKSLDKFPPLKGYSKKVFTFSSPDLMFTKPFLNAYETRIYGQLSGNQSGNFIPSEDHPQFKLLRNGSALIGAVTGIGYAISQIQGETGEEINSSKMRWQANDWYTVAATGGTTGLGLNATANNVAILTPTPLTSFMIANIAAQTAYQQGALAAGVVDIWAGGAVTDGLETYWSGTNTAIGLLPGTEAGDYKATRKRNTPLSQLPALFRASVGIFTSASNIAIGGNEIIELIYNLVNKSDFVLKYNSAGFFNKYQKTNTGLWRFKNTDSNYLGQSFQTFNQGDYKINNLFRPSTVAVALEKELQNPSVEDKSRFVVGGYQPTVGEPVDFPDNYLLDPSSSRKTAISAFYGALKFNFDNQYGQLSGIKQVPMRGCVELLDPTKPAEYLYSSKAIFGGDIYINRYTEKVIMPIFSQYLLGQPDEFTYDYSMHVNIPYPRFWLNSQRYDMTKLSRGIANPLTLIGNGSGGLYALLPNDLFYLDRGNNSCGTTFGSLVSITDPNPMFAMRFAYMYSHSNGILDFFVESEVNLAQRDWEDRQDARIYDVYDYNDTKELFHAQIEKKDNFYKYDESLSVSKFPTQLSSFGEIQPLYYDPYVAANCYVSRPKRLIYSLQAQEESKKDFWRVFLPFNYKDFKNKVSVIKPINKSGAIVFFPYLSPQMFQGLDTLKTQLDTKLTIGDGGLFSQPFQNVANADLSNEYGSCESLRSVMNTPVGLFFISQAQGKIFQYGGGGLDPISNNGMKWWFNKYLPSQLVKQFPELEYSVLSDNPVIGVGCQTVYDPNDDIVYFMKKDFRVKQQYINSITYNEAVGFILNIREDGGRYSVPIVLGDPIYFDDCCWTISYDPKAKAWISFHDWCPELSLPSINHFFTTKSLETDIPQCPPGYNFNSTTGQCEITLNETVLSTVDISTVAATVTGGTVDCLIDVVIAMDWSGSTGTPNYNPVTGVMGNTSRATAQLRWLDVFLQDPAIQSELTSGNMQIGFTGWGTISTPWDPMSNTKSRISIINWYLANWTTTNQTDAQQAIFGNANSPTTGNGALALLNNKAGSSLGDRSSSSFFKQILITVTDGTGGNPAGGVPNSGIVSQQQSPTIIAGSGQPANTGSWALTNLGGATKQELIGVFCGADATWPSTFNSVILDSLTNTRYNTSSSTPGTNQYTMNAQNNSELESVANDVAGSLCSIPFVCSCPTGYTTVYLNPVTGTYSADAGDCNNITPPICRKIECECPTSPNGGTTTITGVCDDVYLVGNPDYVNPDPQLCNYYYINTTPPNYKVGSFWRHNSRCDDFASFYNVSYPWEVDLVANTGQQVNTVRSMEYQLECYVYKGDMGNACNDDKWEDLDFNFDQSVIYNNEQVSGLLQLTPTPYNQPLLNLTYPIIGLNNINILCSKVEQKYRFNQFWDITNDRGEFTNAEQPIWNTEPNGYIRNLNTINLNYNKPPLQHKKFRNYFNSVILRRVNSSNRKMLLRLNNSKLLTSLR